LIFYIFLINIMALGSALGRQRRAPFLLARLVDGQAFGCAVAQGRWMGSHTVYDALVHVKVIDGSGRVHTLTGLEGTTVADLFQQHTAVLGLNAIAASPEGRGKVEAHVKVPTELFDAIPAPRGDDVEWMQQVADPSAVDEHSRLGSRIVLGKELDGMTVSVGDIYPWKTL
jgi:hypothetical protein